MNKTKKAFFYFEKLDWWDKITIGLYIILTIIAFNPNWVSFSRDYYSFYSIGTIIFLIMMNYKSMRKFNVFLFWVIISLVHLYIFFKFKDSPFLQTFRGNNISLLSMTWIFLLNYQLCRWFMLFFNRKEFVIPQEYSRYDFFDNRKVEKDDVIIFFFQMAVFIILVIFKTS